MVFPLPAGGRTHPRMRKLLAIAVLLIAVLVPTTATAAPSRTITLVNHTGQTIWPAASPGSTSGQTGGTLKPGAEVSFQVPHDWDARLWGRTGCHFGGGAGHCRTGDCAPRVRSPLSTMWGNESSP
jgi:Thaumatin family